MRITRALPVALLTVLLGSLALVGCSGATTGGPSGTAKQDPALLEGSNWVATQIRDSAGTMAPVVASSRATAQFKAGVVNGSASINQYRGTYTVAEPDAIAIQMGPSTLMGGPEELMVQETNFTAAMGASKTYTVSSEKLELFDESGKPTVVFEAGKKLSLVGPTWYCTGYNNGKDAVVGLETGSQITIQFSADDKIAGSAGVNQYSTTYSAPEGVEAASGPMKIDAEIITTRMAGPDELMAQEQAYLAALPTTTRFEIQNEELILWNGDARVAGYRLTPLE